MQESQAQSHSIKNLNNSNIYNPASQAEAKEFEAKTKEQQIPEEISQLQANMMHPLNKSQYFCKPQPNEHLQPCIDPNNPINENLEFLPNKSIQEPTEQELCYCIRMLKQKLPGFSMQGIISGLHSILFMAAEDSHSLIRRKSPQDQIKKISPLPQADGLSEDVLSKTQAKFLEVDPNMPRFNEERQVANIFIQIGYGYPKSKEACSFELTPNKYNNIITAIIKTSFRKLEAMARRLSDGKNFPELTKFQQKHMRTPLVKYKAWIGQEAEKVFQRLIRQVYKIPVEPLTPSEVTTTYETIVLKIKNLQARLPPAIIKAYHQRVGEIPLNFGTKENVFNFNEFWTDEKQEDFGRLYLSHKKLSEVRLGMIDKYPILFDHFDSLSVKNRFEKMLKNAFKKLIVIKKRYANQLPDLRLDEDKAKMVMRQPSGTEARLKLVAFYLDTHKNPKRAGMAIESINKLLQYQIEGKCVSFITSKRSTGKQRYHPNDQDLLVMGDLDQR